MSLLCASAQSAQLNLTAMDKKAKESYRQLIQSRYQRANKQIKQRILMDIEQSLPFPLLSNNSDSGKF